MQALFFSKTSKVFFLALAAGLILLRFFSLGADFPTGITKSASIFTDEGWYTAAAIRYYFFDAWYVAGDFNAATNVPTAQAIFFAMFAFLEPSFASGRLATVLFSVLIILLLSNFVRQRFGMLAACICLFWLACNFLFFAYSRLMLLEIIGITFGLIGLVLSSGQPNYAKLALAGLATALAVLTKTTMIVFVPVITLLLFLEIENKKQSVLKIAFWAGVMTICVSAFFFYAGTTYPEDFAYFKSLNLNNRSFDGIGAWALNLPYVGIGLRHFGYEVIALTFLIVVYALYRFESYRKDPVVLAMVLFGVCYMGLLSLVSYNPPRYYLPLIIPLAILCSTAIAKLCANQEKLKTVCLIGFTAVVLAQSYRIAAYSVAPTYTFREMTHGVKATIQQYENKQDISDVIVLGNMVDTIAIETGIRTMNSRLATTSLEARITVTRPDYYVGYDNSAVANLLYAYGAELQQIGNWQVLGGTPKGMTFTLYKVVW